MDEQLWRDLVRDMVRQRVISLCKQGKSREEIHDIIVPFGSGTFPSQYMRIIGRIIDIAKARGLLEDTDG